MRFRILGPLEVLSTDGWTAIGALKWRLLLACLLLRSGQLASTELLIDELWGDSPPSTANNLVSIYVHRLRKVIGDADGKVLVHRAPGYLLRLEPGDLDLHEFESKFDAARRALEADDLKTAASLLSDALSLWRGPLLADVPPSPLIASHADRVAELWLAATELRIDADLACDRAGQVVPELRGLVQQHPMRERFWLLLMRALEDEGRRAEALEVFGQAREVIAAELGVDPGAELQQFFRELLAADASAGVIPSKKRVRRPAPTAPAPPTRSAGTTPVRDGVASGPEASVEPSVTPDADAQESPGTIAIGTFAGVGAPETAQATDAAASASVLATRPQQLPADIGDFTGREDHVGHLCDLLLAVNEDSPGAIRLAVVNGAAGLGKTTLAVHAAHKVKAQFPDGQLYVDLLGASAQSAAPGEVLARFLRDLGVEGDKVPARDDERAALYRTTLTGRRMLILLDNARDAAQVRPLLPGSSSCAVLVTTRNRTADLASTRSFDLNVLDDDDALALFSRIVGPERAAAEPDATAEVLVACAGLPLAIRICAARLTARRGWKVATLASRLRNVSRRLDEMKTGDLAVRASFQVSYDSLRPVGRGPDPARVFRLLGLWQGTTISLPAAAALIGEPEEDVSDVLEALVDVNLLESPVADRYRFHDLLRVYATERAEAEESTEARAAVVVRLLGWYLGAAESAANVVSPLRYQVAREAASEEFRPLAFGSTEEALAWYDDERANVVAAVRQATAVGVHEIAWRLPVTLYPLFNRRSNWADCVTSQRIAAQSVRSTGNRLGEAWVRNHLGFALAKVGDRESFGHLEQALAIRREFGDRAGEAQSSLALGEAYLRIDGPTPDALRYMQHTADLMRPMGPSPRLAAAVNNLGEVHFERGDLDAAAECYSETCEIFREIGGYGEGHALHNLGLVHLRQRRFDDAFAVLNEAVRKHRAAGDLSGEAVAFTYLGQAHELTGNVQEARRAWSTALAIFEKVGDQTQAAEAAAALSAIPR